MAKSDARRQTLSWPAADLQTRRRPRFIVGTALAIDAMIRRDPTRIELKLEDIQEYEQMKRKMEEEKKQKSTGSPMDASGAIAPDAADHPLTSKTKTEIIHERIGYDPAPKI